ncbi:MAG: DUF2127 domain-containing protein [Dolichospermum sp. DET50]|jgi:uncharacterized membrane protein (DUF2068 family)|nr:DUF2127 domain-containing protein [Dolichospermum sp. DET66]MBS3033816.1 DUF2127 domain-containing protein [Dolichospermum sp. DET67]MBS3039019.1 DUF2127 domain-containing protein [Dolichospermum sp. DET50]QSX66271.1 MAG: DUF2127 domain-containing protein [Dolichospermum sp. DET69]
MNKHPPGLVAIVIYKGFVALLLTATSIVLLLALKKHDALVTFSDSYVLEGKLTIIEWLIEEIINIKPQTLKFSGIAMAIYAIVTAIEAVGLWYEKTWAKILVIGLVGISIPPEIFELIKGFTTLKVLVFIANIAVLWYLIRHLSKH